MTACNAAFDLELSSNGHTVVQQMSHLLDRGIVTQLKTRQVTAI